MRAPATALVLVLALLLAACTGDAGPEDAAPGTPTDAGGATTAPPGDAAGDPTATATATTAPTDATEGPAGGDDAARDAALELVLGLLEGAELDEGAYADAFAQTFRDQVPYEDFLEVIAQLQLLAPYTTGAPEPATGGRVVVEALAEDGTTVVVSLGVDDAGDIDALLFTPGGQPELEATVEDLDDAVDQLSAQGTLRLAASTATGTSCTTDLGVAADQPAPIGSIAKLYVLGAVADAVDAGRLGWTDPLEVTEDVISLPSGELQDRPPGTTATVAEAAALVMEISDNTAADLLLRAVGREQVEAAQAGWGHQAPELNTPFPTTRELFQLKAADPDVQQAWVEGDEGARRAILDDLAGQSLPPPTLFADGPVRPDAIEWFASPEDLCRVLTRLWARAQEPGMGPLRDALTANPGVPDAEGRWQTIVFKGGSEPGLVAGAFLVVDDDGAVRTLTASVVDPREELDAVQAVLVLGAARDLLPAG